MDVAYLLLQDLLAGHGGAAGLGALGQLAGVQVGHSPVSLYKSWFAFQAPQQVPPYAPSSYHVNRIGTPGLEHIKHVALTASRRRRARQAAAEGDDEVMTPVSPNNARDGVPPLMTAIANLDWAEVSSLIQRAKESEAERDAITKGVYVPRHGMLQPAHLLLEAAVHLAADADSRSTSQQNSGRTPSDSDSSGDGSPEPMDTSLSQDVSSVVAEPDMLEPVLALLSLCLGRKRDREDSILPLTDPDAQHPLFGKPLIIVAVESLCVPLISLLLSKGASWTGLEAFFSEGRVSNLQTRVAEVLVTHFYSRLPQPTPLYLFMDSAMLQGCPHDVTFPLQDVLLRLQQSISVPGNYVSKSRVRNLLHIALNRSSVTPSDSVRQPLLALAKKQWMDPAIAYSVIPKILAQYSHLIADLLCAEMDRMSDSWSTMLPNLQVDSMYAESLEQHAAADPWADFPSDLKARLKDHPLLVENPHLIESPFLKDCLLANADADPGLIDELIIAAMDIPVAHGQSQHIEIPRARVNAQFKVVEFLHYLMAIPSPSASVVSSLNMVKLKAMEFLTNMFENRPYWSSLESLTSRVDFGSEHESEDLWHARVRAIGEACYTLFVLSRDDTVKAKFVLPHILATNSPLLSLVSRQQSVSSSFYTFCADLRGLESAFAFQDPDLMHADLEFLSLLQIFPRLKPRFLASAISSVNYMEIAKATQPVRQNDIAKIPLKGVERSKEVEALQRLRLDSRPAYQVRQGFEVSYRDEIGEGSGPERYLVNHAAQHARGKLLGILLGLVLVRQDMTIDVDKIDPYTISATFYLGDDVEYDEDIAAVRQGLFRMVPRELLAVFSPEEIRELLAGASQIDVNEWEMATVYEGYDKDSQVVKWFWQIVRDMDEEQRRQLWVFVHGSGRVPSGGFASLEDRFKVVRSGDETRLPSAMTCVNQLMIPPYGGKHELERKLCLAVAEGKTFEFV